MTNNKEKKVKMLSDNPTLEEVASYFANDQFATRAAGCTVVEASRGHAVCEMKLTEIHRNATGNVMAAPSSRSPTSRSPSPATSASPQAYQ